MVEVRTDLGLIIRRNNGYVTGMEAVVAINVCVDFVWRTVLFSLQEKRVVSLQREDQYILWEDIKRMYCVDPEEEENENLKVLSLFYYLSKHLLGDAKWEWKKWREKKEEKEREERTILDEILDEE
jgi:hypothetical protein